MKMIKRLLRKMLCKHNRVFIYYPEKVYFKAKETHGLKITCCVDCGKVAANDYAE